MNIRNNEAGYVAKKHILESGFKVDKSYDISDMGQVTYTMFDYSKDDKLFLTGGYWTYYLADKDKVLLWEGWWNSNEEFDATIKEIEKSLTPN